jgi:hypothetical protein
VDLLHAVRAHPVEVGLVGVAREGHGHLAERRPEREEFALALGEARPGVVEENEDGGHGGVSWRSGTGGSGLEEFLSREEVDEPDAGVALVRDDDPLAAGRPRSRRLHTGPGPGEAHLVLLHADIGQ